MSATEKKTKKDSKPNCAVCGDPIRQKADGRDITEEMAIQLKGWHGREFLPYQQRVHDKKCRRKPKRKQPATEFEEKQQTKPPAKPAPSSESVLSICLFRRRKQTEFNSTFNSYKHSLIKLVRFLKVSALSHWLTVVYVDASVNEKERHEILQDGADQVRVPQNVPSSLLFADGKFKGFLGTLMRYYAFVEFPEAKRVICLDADLPFTQTLEDALTDFCKSKHEVLRAHHSNYRNPDCSGDVLDVPLCGGFFGLAGNALKHISSVFLSMLSEHFPDKKEVKAKAGSAKKEKNAADKQYPYGCDQRFLADRVFPLLKSKYSFLTLALTGQESLPKVTPLPSHLQARHDTIYESRVISHRELL